MDRTEKKRNEANPVWKDDRPRTMTLCPDCKHGKPASCGLCLWDPCQRRDSR